jgi:putative transposase
MEKHMTIDRKLYQRRTTRLWDYDYAQSGFYFVTICTHNKKWMFGEIVNEEMHLNNAGKIVEAVWNTLPQRFRGVKLDEYVVMPNHMHGIIVIEGIEPIEHFSSDVPERFKDYMNRGTIHQQATKAPLPHGRDKSGPYPWNTAHPNDTNTSPILGEIVRTFKAVTARHIRTSGMPNFRWQERFHDYIIRNDSALNLIRQYIINNPAQWAEDTLNIKEGTLV